MVWYLRVEMKIENLRIHEELSRVFSRRRSERLSAYYYYPSNTDVMFVTETRSESKIGELKFFSRLSRCLHTSTTKQLARVALCLCW